MLNGPYYRLPGERPKQNSFNEKNSSKNSGKEDGLNKSFDAMVLLPLLMQYRPDQRARIDGLMEMLKEICPYLDSKQRKTIVSLLNANQSLEDFSGQTIRDYEGYSSRPLNRFERQKGMFRILGKYSGSMDNIQQMERNMDMIEMLNSVRNANSSDPMQMMQMLGMVLGKDFGGMGDMSKMMQMMQMMNSFKT